MVQSHPALAASQPHPGWPRPELAASRPHPGWPRPALAASWPHPGRPRPALAASRPHPGFSSVAKRQVALRFVYKIELAVHAARIPLYKTIKTCENESDMECLEILHFDRSKGMKKCKTPFKIEPLKVIDAQTLDKNFCKKNPETGVQKQIKCLACRCQIEASSALKSHLKGDKHNKALETYVPRPVQIPKTLKM